MLNYEGMNEHQQQIRDRREFIRKHGRPPRFWETVSKTTTSKPVVKKEAVEKPIKKYYVEMRNKDVSEAGVKAVPITARQLEALIRLAEAHAKLRLSNTATKRDAKRAIDLMHYCLSNIGIDPETGNNRYPEMKAFTENIDFNDQQIEIYPGCESVDESNQLYQCSSAKVVLFDRNFQPFIDEAASEELTKKIIGVVFKGDKHILFPKTKDAKVINN